MRSFRGSIVSEEPNLFDTDLPILPYAGTSGHSGSATSEERARRDDSNGTTAHRQLLAINYLTWRGITGATWKEFAEYAHLHHGQASGVLSVLHKDDRILRLKERRDRCAVYVTAQNVCGRDIDAYKRNLTKADMRADIEELASLIRDNRPSHALARIDELRFKYR